MWYHNNTCQIIIRLSVIIWVNAVLNRTVADVSDWRFSNLCGCHLQSSKWWLMVFNSTDLIQLTLTLKMTTAQVVEMSVTVNNNGPIQDYVHPDEIILNLLMKWLLGSNQMGKRWGLGLRDNVLATCKVVTLHGGQRIIAVFIPQQIF